MVLVLERVQRIARVGGERVVTAIFHRPPITTNVGKI